jgi:lia operon protein LiaG
MTHHRLTAALLSVAILAPAALSAQKTVRLSPVNGRVAVWNITGSALIEQGSGTDVEVEITSRGADSERMIVDQGSLGGKQTLRIYYPADEIRPAGVTRRRGRGWSTTMRMRDDGRFGDNGMSGRRIKVWEGADFEASADLVIRVPRGVDFKLYVAVGSVEASRTDGTLAIDTHSGNVNTSETSGSLNIDTGSGDVDVRTHSGDLIVDTGSGDVSVNGVKDARSILLDTGSGDVVAEHCSASGDMKIDTGSGRVTALDIDAREIVLDTGSGDVEVSPSAAATDLKIDTGSGSVTLIAPSNFGAALEISTGSGGIRSDLPLLSTRRSDGELSAKIGDGRTRVSIDTGSGEVAIRGRI